MSGSRKLLSSVVAFGFLAFRVTGSGGYFDYGVMCANAKFENAVVVAAAAGKAQILSIILYLWPKCHNRRQKHNHLANVVKIIGFNVSRICGV
jgi:hypothetical protein